MSWHANTLDRRGLGAATFAGSEDEQRRARESEEQRVERYDVVQDLIVLASQRDDRCPDALQDDRCDRNPRTRIELRDGAEEHAVERHRIVGARCRQNTLAEKSDGRDRDAERNETRAAIAER